MYLICQCCGSNLQTEGESQMGMCNSCLDEAHAAYDQLEQEQREAEGYFYTDENGDKCWTPDFEESIGE